MLLQMQPQSPSCTGLQTGLSTLYPTAFHVWLEGRPGQLWTDLAPWKIPGLPSFPALPVCVLDIDLWVACPHIPCVWPPFSKPRGL
jgi:hypothetical protein